MIHRKIGLYRFKANLINFWALTSRFKDTTRVEQN